jgi:hypothetical protein
MRRRLLGAAMVIVCVLAVVQCGCSTITHSPATGAGGQATSESAGDARLAQAFADHAVDLEVEGEGTVAKLLADDTSGARHQRFIVRLASGQTLLVAHNIDSASRVSPLEVGDTVSFKGVYEWNFIEQISIDGVTNLAKVIEVPPQLLLGVSCPQCGGAQGPSRPPDS